MDASTHLHGMLMELGHCVTTPDGPECGAQLTLNASQVGGLRRNLLYQRVVLLPLEEYELLLNESRKTT